MGKLNKLKMVFFGFLFLTPTMAFAIKAKELGGISTLPNQDKNPDIQDIILNVITWILGFSMALAVLFIVIGGIIYITSAGSEEKIKKAKGIIMAAIIGFVLIVMALVIVRVVERDTRQVVECQPGEVKAGDVCTPLEE